MSAEAYTKVVHYWFVVDDKIMAITEVGDDYVCVEEVRKNGQEDCHMAGVLVLDGSKFVWSEGKSTFVDYASEELADCICDYLNTHSMP